MSTANKGAVVHRTIPVTLYSVHHAVILCTGATFCLNWLVQLDVFGAVSSSSILRPIQHIYFMVHTFFSHLDNNWGIRTRKLTLLQADPTHFFFLSPSSQLYSSGLLVHFNYTFFLLNSLSFGFIKGTGTRDLIWLKVVSLDRSWIVWLTDDLKIFLKCCFIFFINILKSLVVLANFMPIANVNRIGLIN